MIFENPLCIFTSSLCLIIMLLLADYKSLYYMWADNISARAGAVYFVLFKVKDDPSKADPPSICMMLSLTEKK